MSEHSLLVQHRRHQGKAKVGQGIWRSSQKRCGSGNFQVISIALIAYVVDKIGFKRIQINDDVSTDNEIKIELSKLLSALDKRLSFLERTIKGCRKLIRKLKFAAKED